MILSLLLSQLRHLESSKIDLLEFSDNMLYFGKCLPIQLDPLCVEI
jgi:hypothetical protein